MHEFNADELATPSRTRLTDREAAALSRWIKKHRNGAGDFGRFRRFGRIGVEQIEPPREEAFHGIAGEFVTLVEPETEAYPAAILMQLLALSANAFGSRPYVELGADRHGARLNVCVVGPTSSARKGSSLSLAERVVGLADPSWLACRTSNVSSGEVIPWAIRDDQIVTKGGVQTIESGVADKRLYISQSEFSALLAVAGRDSSTLSPILRDAWDRDSLRTTSKASPAIATGAHVTVVGHITEDELRRSLTRTERANGFANRFLWIAARRSKLLPRGGKIPDLAPLAERLATMIDYAKDSRKVEHDGGFWDVYEPWYREDAANERPGLVGAILGRAAPYVHRLALVLALLDGLTVIGRQHAIAALAIWDYAERSAVAIFGDPLGDPTADQILSALREAAPDGMPRTELRDLFSRNRDIQPSLELLQQLGLAAPRTEMHAGERGRPPERWYAVSEEPPYDRNDVNDQNGHRR